MSNEILLILSVLMYYGMTLLWFILFGKSGLIHWTVIATIASNIEVIILINAFGMEQTLGNVMFASTFLVTDILSETSGKQSAKNAVNAGIFTSVCFILISQLWLLFTPSGGDYAFENIRGVFQNTPRIMITGLVVYAITQRFDVWLYHKWWQFTEKKFGEKRRFLWLRNNGSTIVSQFLNTVLFTLGAFYGILKADELISVAVASFIIFVITSLLDTPFVYIARFMKEKNIFGTGG